MRRLAKDKHVEASWRDFQCKIYWKRIWCRAVPPIYNTQEVQVDQTLLIGSRESFTWIDWTPAVYPIGSMCMVYSLTFTIKINWIWVYDGPFHPLHLVPVRAAPVHSVLVRVLCSLGAQHRASEGFLWMAHLRAAEDTKTWGFEKNLGWFCWNLVNSSVEVGSLFPYSLHPKGGDSRGFLKHQCQ